MKSYSIHPDLTTTGLGGLAIAVKGVMEGMAKRVDLGHGTTVYKVPSQNPKKFTIRIDMKIEEEE